MQAKLLWTLPWDADWATAACFLGERRVAAGNNLGEILLWDLPDNPGATAPLPTRRLDGHTNTVTRLLPTPDGKTLLSSSCDHGVRCWDVAAPAGADAKLVLNARTRDDLTRRRSSRIPPPLEVTVKTQQSSRALSGHKEWVSGLSLSADGKTLLSGDDGGQVVVWDLPAGKEVRRWKIKGWCQAVALSPDAKLALISERVHLVFDSGRHAGVKLWDATTGTLKFDLDTIFKGMYLSAAAFAPDGKVLAIGRGGEVDGLNGKVTLIDPTTGKKTRELTPGHEHGITDLAFTPDGKHLASSGRDTLIRLWEVSSGKLVAELGKSRGGQFKDWIHAIAFSPSGKLLVGADMVGAVHVWSVT